MSIPYYLLPHENGFRETADSPGRVVDPTGQGTGEIEVALVRQALEQRRSQPGKSTCLDLMQDLCGSVSGPRDLSTNPKHLAGFGK